MSKVVQSLDQRCPSTRCFGRTLKSSTGASHPVTSASSLPVPCVLVLVTKFPLGSWEHDTILYLMPKVRPSFNPHLQTYPGLVLPNPIYLWSGTPVICAQQSQHCLPESPVLNILFLHGHGQPIWGNSSLFFQFSVMTFKACSRWTPRELTAFLFQSYLGCYYLPSPGHRCWRGIPSVIHLMS